ncbi:Gfo/Idh/MocA family oxidoreductase [Paenibacillus sp.]|uniref:Gfo/Idh/MocA family protein n=1 Tax=Paenibacillus sp. TaxID=58172 RepID=UPI0028124F0C|nr:Gfo/Idh/MocA family oxidoreductase [Paenibacillus sp.]
MNATVKWGIMGPGGIARAFAADLKTVPGAELVAVASKSRQRADAFAGEFGIPRAYDDYEAFVRDEEVEIVYIGTLHPAHKELMLLCLRHGKAVVCEKPFTMNASEAEEVANAARANGTFAMEAMWTRFLPPIVQARAWIAEGRIGEVKAVTANFGFDVGWRPESRLLNKELGGGALLDAGIYPVSFASMIFGRQPERISSSAWIGETGVDERFAALFEYDGGRTAQIGASVRLRTSNDAYVYGSEGYIHLPNFLFGRTASLHLPNAEPVVCADDRLEQGYRFEAMEAMACLRDGRLESAVMPLDETVDIMRTLDRLREQWGLEY